MPLNLGYDRTNARIFRLRIAGFGCIGTFTCNRSRLGEPLFLPDVIGFKMALISVIAIMCLWYLLATWNEVIRKLVID